ncbi:MAG TPA: multicopper oxidase [Anaeromyxobacteraceae bacterium]|nr:multicopper oxidase [Anaeromyxobacteraceae bacterium]
MQETRRWATATGLAIAVTFAVTARAQPLPGGSLDPTFIPKYVTQLVAPPAMPRSQSDLSVDYQIAVRQFQQQILPPGYPMTTVWSYGSIDHPGTVAQGGSFFYPAFTIEARAGTAVQVKWINDLKDSNGGYLKHLLPVDTTIHWANPPKQCIDGSSRTDCAGFPSTYTGPVPIVTHLHGSHVDPESDGYPEAWYLPAAKNIPGGFATRGSHFGQAAGAPDVAGQAIFRYRNDQAATTLWYHDHTLGITRLNVYAGPAGFYLLRGGQNDLPSGVLPGPAPGVGANPFGKHYEIPIVIQDRSFNADGSLFYPGTRRFFDGYNGPFIPSTDISPKWNPETFGNFMVVNGRTWPYLEVEPRKYRFRFLNGCNARFLILTTGFPDAPALTFQRIGADGGFLPAPLPQTSLLLGPAERADVVVDFSGFAVGTNVDLQNVGPDEPFGGGVPNQDFAVSDPGSTGQVMRFKVVPLASVDSSSIPEVLPSEGPLGASSRTRRVSLNEASSRVRCLNAKGFSVSCLAQGATEFGPVHSNLGPVDGSGNPVPTPWADAITENPALGATETWEMYNFTADAHPIHIHLVQFQILDRQPLVTDAEGITAPPVAFAGPPRPPESWETGRKDTVIVFPGEVARVKALYDIPGLFVWHCHILEHEDNEMMRPYRIGP